MVPKKSRVTTVHNEKGEEMPTLLTTGWRVCIDYRRLNEVTRKDHSLYPSWTSFSKGFSGTPSTTSWMAIQVIFKLKLLQKTRRRPPSPTHLAHMPTGGCPLAYVMPLPHSSDACSVSSAIWWSALWRFTWMML